MNLLFLTALIPILLITSSHVFATSNQTSSNETTTTNNLLKQILNELEQIRQLQQQHPVLTTPPNAAEPVPPFLSLPPSINATTCKQQNDNGVLITNCANPVFPGLGQQVRPPPPPMPPANLPRSPPFLTNLPPDLADVDTVYGVFCPAN